MPRGIYPRKRNRPLPKRDVKLEIPEPPKHTEPGALLDDLIAWVAEEEPSRVDLAMVLDRLDGIREMVAAALRESLKPRC